MGTRGWGPAWVTLHTREDHRNPESQEVSLTPRACGLHRQVLSARKRRNLNLNKSTHFLQNLSASIQENSALGSQGLWTPDLRDCLVTDGNPLSSATAPRSEECWPGPSMRPPPAPPAPLGAAGVKVNWGGRGSGGGGEGACQGLRRGGMSD